MGDNFLVWRGTQMSVWRLLGEGLAEAEALAGDLGQDGAGAGEDAVCDEEPERCAGEENGEVRPAAVRGQVRAE